MPQIYNLLTAVLAFTGCASLITSGEVSPLMSMIGIGLFPGYYRFLKGYSHAPGWAIGGFSVLTLLVFLFDSLIVSKDFLLSVAHLTITFQTIKSFDLKEPWDHLQVYFMSLLQLIIASELTDSIVFGAIFVFFLVTLVTSIVLAHFKKESATLKVDAAKPVKYITLLTLLITAIFFISIPRVSSGLWAKGHLKKIKSVGFSEKVNLGSFGKLKLDPTVIMRIELDPMIPGPYYWRGMTFDYYDGKSWNSTIIITRRSVKKIEAEFVVRPSLARTITQRVMLEPIDSDVIFGLDRVVSIKGNFSRLEKNPATSLFVPGKGSKRFQYVVVSDNTEAIQSESTVSRHGERYRDIPDSLRDKLKALTETILRSARIRQLSDLRKAEIIETYLKKNYRYSLNVKPPDDNSDPILYFLFTSKTGFCEHYATAMVMMFRTLGIPARIVTGFYGGELNEYGNYIIVRQSNAHSWVEAVIDGKWKRFDPTPPVPVERLAAVDLFIDMLRMKWDRYVVAFSFSDQKEIVRAFSILFRLPQIPDYSLHGFRRIIYFLITVSGTILVIFLLRRLRFKKYGFATARYIRLKNIIRNKGAEITSSSTAAEVRREAVRLGMDGNVEKFVELYEKYRFGGREMAREDRDRYQKLLADISRSSK